MPKILAIDDVLDNLITIELILKSYLPDCQVFTATSGKEGLVVAEEKKPDTILLDILMPEMDGYEVCRILKNQESTRQIPVILVSALGSIAESRVKGLNAGGDVFIAKPIDPAELVAQVKVMLRIKEVEDNLRIERNNLEKLVEIRTSKLIEAQKRYRSIIEDQTQAIIRYKAEGILTFVNDSYCKMHERNRDELIGLSRYTLIAPEDIDSVRNKIEGLTLENPVQVDEHKSVLSNGKIKWQQWTDRAIFDDEGNILEYQAEGVDITDRKKAEEKLRQSEEKFRQLAENIGQVFWLASPDMENIFYISPAYQEVWGKSCDSLMENPTDWFVSIFEEEKAPVKAVLDVFPENCEEIKFPEFRIRRPDGTYRWVQANAYPIRDNEGKISRIAGLAKDITESKNAEDALRVSEEKFRTIVEASPDAVMTTDLDSNIIYASQRTAEVYGFDNPQEMIGLNSIELIAPDLRNNARVLLKKTIGEGPLRDEKFIMLKKDGSTFHGELSASIIKNKSGEPDAFILITKDITERKNAEDAIKVYQQNLRSMTSELNLAVEKERRRIAVDLHDHLGQSLAMARIKLSGMKSEPLPEKTIEDLVETEKYVIDAIKNSRTLTYELSPPVLFELGLPAAINWKLEQLNSKYNLNTNLEVEDEVPDINEDLLILLFRSVGELLNNIIKHSEASSVNVKVNFKGRYLNISVSDNGKGFETKKIDSRYNKTAGIGLFSIRERLEYFQGKMYIESSPGKGTKIYLSVPVNT